MTPERWQHIKALLESALERDPLERNAFLDEAMVVSQQKASEVIALDDALNELALIDPQQSRIVELRFFGGLTVEETAEVLHLSPATIKREWSTAKAWLYHQLVNRE